MNNSSKNRIFVVDDHRLFREGLINLIEKEQDMTVVAEADNGREAVQSVIEISPDIVIMDVSMPDLNGIDATKQILKEDPDVKIIGLSMHVDKSYVKSMISAGVSGYVAKDSAFEELAKAIRAVLAGKLYLSSTIEEMVKEDYFELIAEKGKKDKDRLSLREREVLQLLAEGYSPKEISARLNLSIKTIETHKSNIQNKLGIHNIAELTKFAIKHGITSL